MTAWILGNSLEAGALAVLVGLAAWISRPGPAVRHALWLVVLVKLASPPLLAWPWTSGSPARIFEASHFAANWPSTCRDPSLDEPVEAEEVALAAADLPVDAAVAPESEQPPPRAAGSEDMPEPAAHTGPALAIPGAAGWAAACWLLGTVAMTLLQTWRVLRLRRLTAPGTPAPADLQAVVAEVAGTMGVQAPPVMSVRGLHTPLVWSIGPARLLVPAALLAGPGRLSPGAWKGVIAHELAHIKRRDHWLGWVLLATTCAAWWHPLHALVRRRLEEAAEEACDAWAVWALPGTRREYAETLIEVSRQSRRERFSLLDGAPLPALRRRGGARRALERRLTMILNAQQKTRLSPWARLGIVSLACLSVPSWSRGQETTDEPVTTPRVSNDPGALPELPKVSERKTAVTRPRDGHDDRLAEIERKLQALFEEVRALRGATDKAPRNELVVIDSEVVAVDKDGDPARVVLNAGERQGLRDGDEAIVQRNGKVTGKVRVTRRDRDPAEARIVSETTRGNIERGDSAAVVAGAPGSDRYQKDSNDRTVAVYTLPAGKAQALVRFLLESGATGLKSAAADERSGQVIIHATAQAQKRIGQFIELLQDEPPPAGEDGASPRRR